MEFRDGHAMSIDADIRIIRHMLDKVRYMQIMRILMQISASAWKSLNNIIANTFDTMQCYRK